MRVCPYCGVRWAMSHNCTWASDMTDNEKVELLKGSHVYTANDVKDLLASGTPHLHPEYVPGCFRCDLSRCEVAEDPLQREGDTK